MKAKPKNTTSKGTKAAMAQCKPGMAPMETMKGMDKSHKGM